MKLQLDKKYILFSSDFKTRIKNPDLALQALNVLADPEIHLLELTNYTRNEVAVLLNAVDVALMTSFSEGSPQFIKEALACNCPVVSTDVGDVSDNIKEIQGCFITTYQAKDVAEKLKKALEQPKLLNGRDHIKHLDNAFIANKVLQIYLSINSK